MNTDRHLITKHIIVSGKVQGVFFRVHTKKRANTLGITGWIKNKPNGNVEIMATGERTALDILLTWLHKGSPLSNVDDIQSTDNSLILFDVFEIKKDTP